MSQSRSRLSRSPRSTCWALVQLFLLSIAPAGALDCFWNPVDGNWNDSANWGCGVVPDNDDTAFLHAGGTVNVTEAASVGSISMITNLLTGDADLTVTNSMSWQGGTLAGTGKIIIVDTAAMTISAGGPSGKFLNRTIENFGDVTVSAGFSGTSGVFENRSTGTMTFDADLTFSANLLNEGMIVKSAGAGNSFFAGGFTQTATGTTEVQSGSLQISGSGAIDGELTATDSSIWFRLGATFTLGGAAIDVSDLVLTGNAVADFTGADSVTFGNFTLNGAEAYFDNSIVWINGDFSRNAVGGVFDAGASKFVFGGNTTQSLTISRPTEFYLLEVQAGTRLVETVEDDNTTVSWVLWNRGVIEKTKSVPVNGTVSFGLTGVELEVNDPGTFTSLQVERVGSNHPNADLVTRTFQYWLFTPTGDAFDVDLTLEHCFQPQGDLDLCRYSGASWTCGVDSVTPTDITQLGVTDLDTWAIGLDDPRIFQTGTECGNPSPWTTYSPNP